MQGVKYRILQCVWYGTKKLAGTACKSLLRPPVMKACKGPPCTLEGKRLFLKTNAGCQGILHIHEKDIGKEILIQTLYKLETFSSQ